MVGSKLQRLRSTLDQIAGIGAKRKKALLRHLGSAQAVGRASLADLAAVAGIIPKVMDNDPFDRVPLSAR